jgi:tetratricopeptide (TPR) repeat protein
MPAIFISHSSRDPKIADDIKAALARLGYEQIFLDFDKDSGIGAGSDWEKVLYRELQRCHALILVLTPNWLSSTWCRIELAQARALGKVILPVICAPLGDKYVLPEIQAVDLIDWKADGLARIEKRLQAITSELARGFAFDPRRPPFPGINAFEAEDAAIYFGRDEEVRAVIERLDARRARGGARLLVIIGASGAGKSSLLKAGVLPQLTRRKRDWIVLPMMRPEKAPMEALAKAVAQQRGTPDAWRGWNDRLGGAQGVAEFSELLKDLRIGEQSGATALLPIDQFEELFTVAPPQERSTFLSLLAGALDPGRDLPLMVLATGRSDVLDGLLGAGELAHLYETEPLAPMPLDRVPRLIEGPAAVASLHVDPGLPERMARDLENPDALPLLAYTLWLLHQRGASERQLSLAHYEVLGDPERGLNPIQNSVRRAADQALDSLVPRPTERELAALRDAFVPHLVRVRLDDGKRVRQPARAIDLPEDARRLIQALVSARLLVTRDGLIEVAHEALFKAWPTLERWLGEEQTFLSDLERIRSAQEVWAQAPVPQKPDALLRGLLLSRGRDWLVRHPQRFARGDLEPLRAFLSESAAAEDAERERGRKLRQRLFQAVTAAAAIFAGAAIVAGWLYLEANRARQDAETARQEAVAERDRAERNFAVAKEAADDVVFRLAQGLRNVEGMRADAIRRILETAQTLMDKLARTAPDDLELQHSRLAMFAEFGDTYWLLGDLEQALKAYRHALAIAERHAATDRNNAVWQRALSISYNRIGDVLRIQGKFDDALKAYRDGLAIAERLAAANPGNAQWQRDLAISHNKVGDVVAAQGKFDEALAAYRASIAIFERLAAAEPGNADRQRDLSVSYNKLGDVLAVQGKTEEALTAYRDSLAIAERLAAADPGNTQRQRDLSVSYEKIGNMLATQGKFDEALKAYRDSLAIAERLAAVDPGNTQWQRDLSVSYNKVGDVLLAQGKLDEALKAYRNSLAIFERLAAADRSNTLWQRDLSISHDRVGDVLVAQGKLDEAIEAYERSLAIRIALLAQDPSNAQWRGDLQVAAARIGEVAHRLIRARQFARALEACDRAIAGASEAVGLHAKRAHALMFLDRLDEARTIYLRYRGRADVRGGKSWEAVLREDFADLRKAGLSHPLMDEIESRLAGAG